MHKKLLLQKVIRHEFWLKSKSQKTYRQSLPNVIEKAKCTRKTCSMHSQVKHFNKWNFLSRSLTAPIEMQVL